MQNQNKKQESGNLYCRACKSAIRMPKAPEKCPNCASQEFWFYSLNINSLATLVKKLVPGARVNLIESKNSQPQTTNHKLPTIDIATSSVFYRLVTKKYALVANIATDSPLNVTDFTAAEHAFLQITNLKKLATKILILQTYYVDTYCY